MSALAVCFKSCFVFRRAAPLCFRILLLAGAFMGFAVGAGAFAVTLGEVTTGAAISGTLQGTASSQPQNAIQKAEQAVQQYETAQQQQLDALPSDGGDMAVSSSINPTDASSFEDSATPADRKPAFQGAWFSQNGDNQGDIDTDGLSPHDSSHLRNMTREELEEELKDQNIQDEIEPVDYGRSVQIFYKNKCARQAKNCVKGAVFTNIKSVIFDYARARAGFSKSSR